VIGQLASSPSEESELDTLSRASTTNGCMFEHRQPETHRRREEREEDLAKGKPRALDNR
jgi:hypothetical protein